MDSALFLQIVTTVSDLIIFIFVGFYFWTMQKDRKNLEQRERNVKHKQDEIENKLNIIVEEAHNEKKRILTETSQKANAIIADTKFVSESSKEKIDKALQKITQEIQQQALSVSQNHIKSYENTLNLTSEKTVNQFRTVAQQFDSQMQKQTTELQKALLTNFQETIKKHQQKRFTEADQKINAIVREVAQKVLNKSISYEDHKQLIVKALEKAHEEGVFG